MQANALMHLKKWKELDECCDRGLDLEEISDFYNMKGKALGKMEQFHEKIELTKKAIQIDPKVAAYHRNLGAGYYKVKEY
jgi:tetratricopeptide (TPR) repeat protein